MRASLQSALAVSALVVLAYAGRPRPEPSPASVWTIVTSGLPSALMSVDGTSSRDVYFAGADKGSGPLVVHFDGERWSQLSTGVRGDLWWVHAFDDGSAFFGGTGGMPPPVGRALVRTPRRAGLLRAADSTMA